MKKTIVKLLLALGCVMAFSACQQKQDAWVSYKATVNGSFTMEALAVQEEMNTRLSKALTGGSYELYPDTKANDNAAIQTCDAVYAECAGGATGTYTILLNKSYPSTDPNNIKTVTLKTYNFVKKY